MKKKVYAIKEGYDFIKNVRVKNKLVNTWDECLTYVKGVKGAKYKSFTNLEEAEEYLNDDKTLLIKDKDIYPNDCLHVYVDGSFNIDTGRYSYALVVVKNNIIEYMENGVAKDQSGIKLRQILGELKAATRSYEYAIENNIKKIVLFHDYEGIFHHAIGTWNRKDISSQVYYEKFNKYKNEYGLEVIFVKVDSHTGDLFNEITDNYAKLAGGLQLTNAVDKGILQEKIKVKSEKLKLEIENLISSMNYNKIEVVK
ncbi:ribonuclease H family protein [Hathewaya limosa]|uniref:Ribonuclease HI n=1 Tax=Hathewaya limosa TaxID=1536 RepID=A0ABU0JTW2_HATLI|nr:ribonuclease H family protein [Hathewaya limosa]MDQ0480541.1 ribonuclease HI [Hathewaya limosa]